MKEKNRPLTYTRQLELLKKYYTIDEEKNIIYVKIHFDKASDMVEMDNVKEGHRLLKTEVLSKLSELMDSLPMTLRLDVSFVVDDYEGIDPNEIKESFNDALELSQYRARGKRMGRWFIATLLVLVGVVLLFVYIAGKNNDWFGTELETDIITEIIDIAAWVFIWEAVTVLFLEPTEHTSLSLKFHKRLLSISFYKTGDDKPIVNEDKEEIFHEWVEESRTKRAGKGMLLFASAAYIASAFYSAYSIYELIAARDELGVPLIIVGIATATISAFFCFFAGLSGLSKYMNKENRIARFVGVFCIILSIIDIASIVLRIVYKDQSGLVASSLSLLIDVFYISGYLIGRFSNKTVAEKDVLR